MQAHDVQRKERTVFGAGEGDWQKKQLSVLWRRNMADIACQSPSNQPLRNKPPFLFVLVVLHPCPSSRLHPQQAGGMLFSSPHILHPPYSSRLFATILLRFCLLFSTNTLSTSHRHHFRFSRPSGPLRDGIGSILWYLTIEPVMLS